MSVYLDRPPVDAALFEEIVRRVLSVANADRIIVFGSAAAGTMNKDSDIDLLVLEAEPGHTGKESVKIRESIGDVGHAFDIFVMKTDRFEETKSVIGGLAFPANKYGKVIYEKHDGHCE